MNRHNNKHAGENQNRNQTLEKKEPMQTKQLVINSNVRTTVIAAFGVLSMVLAVSETAQAQANQPTPADIQTAVDAFRNFLGDNNGVGGTFPTGRREIKWDGVPDAFSAPNLLPSNCFTSNSPRDVAFVHPDRHQQTCREHK